MKKTGMRILLFAIISLIAGMTATLSAADASGKKLLDTVYGLLGGTYCKASEVQALLDSGEDVNYLNNDGQSALWIVVSKGNEANTPKYTKERYDWSVEIARLLVAKGANLNVADKVNGRTPLFLALFNGNIECAKLLLQAGADVKIADKSGLAPIHMAAFSGNLDLLGGIIKAGADVNAQSSQNFSFMRPLHFAVRFKHNEAIEPLLKAGADVNGLDRYSATPLYYAAYFDNVRGFQALMENDANPDIKFQNPKEFLSVSSWPNSKEDIVPARQQGFTALEVAKYRSRDVVNFMSPANQASMAVLKEFKKLQLFTSADLGEVDEKGAPAGKALWYLVQKFLIENEAKGVADLRLTEVTVVKVGNPGDNSWPVRIKYRALYLKKNFDANQGYLYTTSLGGSDSLDLRFSKDDFDEWAVARK